MNVMDSDSQIGGLVETLSPDWEGYIMRKY